MIITGASGGGGGQGAVVSPSSGRKVSNGGDGGKGFPGETQIAELSGLSVGGSLKITVGDGGSGGRDGQGFKEDGVGLDGLGGSVLLVPIFEDREEARC